MLYTSKQFEILSPDIFNESENLPFSLEDADAQASLAKFLRYNLGFAWELLTEEKLFPFQEFIINGWFKKDYSLYVASRGVGKSYIIAIFCLLYAIFNPNSKIVIVSSNFRRSKGIFGTAEKILRAKNNALLKQNFPRDISKLPDKITLYCVNGAEIIGLPMGGESLRGERANVLVIDEGLLISEEIQKTILEPFILANLDLASQLKNEELENQLIQEGLMTEEDRSLPPRNKIIVCSSASYDFQYLHEGIFVPHIKNIENSTGDRSKPSYFVCRSSYHIGLKHKIIQQTAIDKVGAEEPGMHDDPIIGREYWGRAANSSNGFFNMRAIRESTVKDGDYPTVLLSGKPKEEYVLAIDPSYSSAPHSDYFAMTVCSLLHEERKICLRHTYARAGGEIADHYAYLVFLLQNFNITYIIIDATGTDGQFIKEFNESAIAKENNIKLKFIEADLEQDGEGYVKGLQQAKSEWNVATKKIVYKHVMSSSVNRKTAELLQSQINARKVIFASKIQMNTEVFNGFKKFDMPFEFKDRKGRPYSDSLEYLTDQDDYIRFVQDQLALIKMSSTANGAVTYDLPAYCARSDDADRPRKDHYSALMMANYAAKHIFDMQDLDTETQYIDWIPVFC